MPPPAPLPPTQGRIALRQRCARPERAQGRFSTSCDQFLSDAREFGCAPLVCLCELKPGTRSHGGCKADPNVSRQIRESDRQAQFLRGESSLRRRYTRPAPATQI